MQKRTYRRYEAAAITHRDIVLTWDLVDLVTLAAAARLHLDIVAV